MEWRKAQLAKGRMIFPGSSIDARNLNPAKYGSRLLGRKADLRPCVQDKRPFLGASVFVQIEIKRPAGRSAGGSDVQLRRGLRDKIVRSGTQLLLGEDRESTQVGDLELQQVGFGKRKLGGQIPIVRRMSRSQDKKFTKPAGLPLASKCFVNSRAAYVASIFPVR